MPTMTEEGMSKGRTRQRPISGTLGGREKLRDKGMQRPKTSGSLHSSNTSLINDRPPSRPPSRQSKRGAGDMTYAQTSVNGLGPTTPGGAGHASHRPDGLPPLQQSWAITHIGYNNKEDEVETSSSDEESHDEPKAKGPTGFKKVLSKSEKQANETMKQWLEGPQLDSDDFDTDLEDDFPPEDAQPTDNTGRFIYERQCLKTGIVPVRYLMRNLGEGNLRMRHHYLGGTGTKPLASALKENTVCEEIDLSDNYIEGDGAKALASVLKDNMFIVNLNISNNFIKTQGSDALCEMLESNTTLKTLTLQGNQLSDKDTARIGEALRNNQSLVALDLSYNHFGEEGGIQIGLGLAANIALADLDLSWNCITRRGAVQIAKAISKNQSLEILDLSWNGISNTGVAAIGVALRVNTTLKVLDISNNRIGEEGAKKLGPCLAKNHGLETLLMGMNPIGEEGVKAILKGVTFNQSLKLVGFEDISMSTVMHERIKEISESRDILIMYTTGAPQAARINETILTVFERFINENADRMEDLFLQMDKDKSGDITLEEFKYGLKDFGLRLTSKQLDALLCELDADKSGTIELEELLAGSAMVQQERMKQAVRARDEEIIKNLQAVTTDETANGE